MDNRLVRSGAKWGVRRTSVRRVLQRAVVEAVEGRVMLCAVHPGVAPSTHEPFIGPYIQGLSPAASVSSEESLAAAMPDGTPTQSNGLPILNSRPAAPSDIYLDFDGNGTQTPYDEDGNSASYNATEQNSIWECWRQVSEYFAIFDINVTTTFTSTRPKAWILLSNSHSGVGYSFVNVFPNSKPESFNPSSDVRTRQSGLAHELGHNFGLAHQSTYDLNGEKVNEYASAPDPLHGLIMGVDYSGKVHKWSIGHPSGSPSTVQDDIAVIASKIRARPGSTSDGFRPDDYGSTIATAHTIPVDSAGTSYIADGIIERMNDVDVFSFTAMGGNVTIDAAPVFPSGADLKLELFDSSGARLATADATDTNFQTLNLSLAPGSYYASVSSHGNYSDLGSYTFGVRDLPDGWVGDDVGVVGWGGAAEFDPATGQYTLHGSGDDVVGGNDEMRFTYQTLDGDGTIVARVTDIENTDNWAAAGVDIRESLATNSRHAAMLMTRNNGPRFISRTSTGGTAATVNNNQNTPFAPRWVKVERTGSSLRGYVSNDGVSWTQYGSATISMTQKVLIGLLVNSESNTELNTSRVDNVTVTGNVTQAPPTYNEMPSPANVGVTHPTTGTGLSLTWDAVEGATGYRVERSADGVTYTQAGQTAAAALTFLDPTLAGALRYFYRVSALDAQGGVSAPSLVGSAVNRPSAVTGLAVTAWQTNSTILNWKDTDGETGYRIERALPGGQYATLGTVAANVPSYTDSTAVSGTTYSYRVVPLSTVGDGLAALTTGTARLAAVSGLSFIEVLSNKISFRWNDLPNETGYKIERSTDGENWPTSFNVAAGVLQYTDTSVSPFTKYYYRVMGTSGTALGVYPTPLIAATPAAAPLPAPWASADVGAVPGRGATSSTSPSTFNMISIGDNVSGTTDQFRFTFQQITGDAQITARVSSIEDTDGGAKAGVMIRDALTTNARHASMFVSPDEGVSFRYRTTVAGQSSTTDGSATTKAPVWLRVTRTGTTLRGSTSSDGITWTDVGTTTISMSATVYVGLAASSYDVAKLGSSAFTNVQVSPSVVLSSSFERPDKLSVTFSGDVGPSLAAGDLLLDSVPAGTSVPATGVTWNAATRTATFTLPRLADGNYRARLLKTNVTDAANYALPADFNYDFFTLTGDVNGDRKVDHADFQVLYANMGQTNRTFSQGDLNLDKVVDFIDFQLLEVSYGKVLTAPLAGEPVSSAAGDEPNSDDLLRSTFSTRPIRQPAPKPAKRIALKAR